MNARGAIELARHLASPSTVTYPDASRLGKDAHLGQSTRQGRTSRALTRTRGPPSVTWGAATGADGKTMWWGARCANEDCSSTNGQVARRQRSTPQRRVGIDLRRCRLRVAVDPGLRARAPATARPSCGAPTTTEKRWCGALTTAKRWCGDTACHGLRAARRSIWGRP